MILKNYINKLLEKYFSLRIERSTSNIVKNVFNTKFKKKVLISYLTDPFTKPLSLEHTNFKENLIIAKCFNELQYEVDVVHFMNNSSQIDYDKYDLIFGFGKPMENFFFGNNSDTQTITYLTGCSTDYSNDKSLVEIDRLNKNHNIWTADDFRLSLNNWPLQQSLSDALIVLGNDFSLNTYSHPKKYSIDNFFTKITNLDIGKKEINYNILWFGSTGLFHKGLHHAIELARIDNTINLHICGPKMKLSSFSQIYDGIIEDYSNIHFHGFINIRGKLFQELMQSCTYLIFPSISEAGCASVLTCIGNGGLIPIIPKSVAIDLENLELSINNNIESIRKIISKIKATEEKEMKQLSTDVYTLVNNRYTEENFYKNLKNLLTKIL